MMLPQVDLQKKKRNKETKTKHKIRFLKDNIHAQAHQILSKQDRNKIKTHVPMEREFCYLLCAEWLWGSPTRCPSTPGLGNSVPASSIEPRLSRSRNVESLKILFVRDAVPTPAILAPFTTPSSSTSPVSRGGISGYANMSYRSGDVSNAEKLSWDLLRCAR